MSAREVRLVRRRAGEYEVESFHRRDDGSAGDIGYLATVKRVRGSWCTSDDGGPLEVRSENGTRTFRFRSLGEATWRLLVYFADENGGNAGFEDALAIIERATKRGARRDSRGRTAATRVRVYADAEDAARCEVFVDGAEDAVEETVARLVAFARRYTRGARVERLPDVRGSADLTARPLPDDGAKCAGLRARGRRSVLALRCAAAVETGRR